MGSTYSLLIQVPIGSMYGIFTNIYPINDPNVGKYTIHGSYGVGFIKIPYGGYSALAGDDANQNHQSMWRCEVTLCRNTSHPLRLHPDLL